jgi:hypothetical protein
MVENVENSFELLARLTLEVDFYVGATEVNCEPSDYPIKSDFVERCFNTNRCPSRIRVEVESDSPAQDSSAAGRGRVPALV